ncbi:ankyrin-1-like [Belonocnema kinseyi]|uniref:ankyrin-1-like n=1 Tax=Belonocnema kinseyi TaxID=2817044 RepID=UPI00143D3BB6|nr:ankyrin-1-like [Belonocnema kinseyi]
MTLSDRIPKDVMGKGILPEAQTMDIEDLDVRVPTEWSLFISALETKDKDSLNSLLYPGSPIISNVHPFNELTALHYVCKSEYDRDFDPTHLISTLINLGANVNAQTPIGCTPLHYALASKHITLAEILIKSGADPHICNHNNESPIHLALRLGSLEGAELFLKDEEKLAEGFSQAERILNLVKSLVREGKSYNLSNPSSSNYSILLHFAMLQQDNESFQYVLENADIYVDAIYEGYTLLHVAVANGTPFMIKALIEKGADTEACYVFDRTPLVEAIIENMPENVHCLLDSGVSVNYAENGDCEINSPLHQAIDIQNLEIMKILLKHGADVNALSYNLPPIFIACGSKLGGYDFVYDDDFFPEHYYDPEIVELLLDHGADIEVRNEEGMTALDKSCETGKIEIVRLLLQRKATINEENFTTLRYAIIGGNADVVRVILKRTDESLNCSSVEYRTPLQFAIRQFRPCKDVLTVLVVFIAKMIARNKYVSEENRETLKDESVRKIYEECEKEIQRMRVKMISNSLKFSFFDIWMKEVDDVGGALLKDDVAEILDQGFYKSEFPKYAQDLEECIQEAKHRRPLVDRGVEPFRKYVKEELPLEIILRIFQDLSVEDLDNFAEACFVNVPRS